VSDRGWPKGRSRSRSFSREVLTDLWLKHHTYCYSRGRTDAPTTSPYPFPTYSTYSTSAVSLKLQVYHVAHNKILKSSIPSHPFRARPPAYRRADIMLQDEYTDERLRSFVAALPPLSSSGSIRNVVRLVHGRSPRRVIGFPYEFHRCIPLHLAYLLHISRSAFEPWTLCYIDFTSGISSVRVFNSELRSQCATPGKEAGIGWL
jgi:hypothetical protein